MKYSFNKKLFDKILTIILLIAIIISVVFLIYIIINPHPGEKFTEFYLLGQNGIADDYPSELIIDENASLIIGIVNHEQTTIDYTVEVWLINQTTEENLTVYNHMWFMDKINISLGHVDVETEEQWTPQWEYNYNFSINKTGSFKLEFLLFTKSTEQYNLNQDYKDIAEEKINSSYRNLHLWLKVE